MIYYSGTTNSDRAKKELTLLPQYPISPTSVTALYNICGEAPIIMKWPIYLDNSVFNP